MPNNKKCMINIDVKNLFHSALFFGCVAAGCTQVNGVEISQDASSETTSSNIDVESTSAHQVFGEWMFKGDFAAQNFSGFNPNYLINVGDEINFQIWGGHEFNSILKVDNQGNIFIPKVGPVKVLGVRNKDLNTHLLKKVKNIYKKNVSVYANLHSAQPVKVFVTGFVNKPGLYAGLSSDSILYYLDKAKGINPESGSYIDITIKRNDKDFKSINLYGFLLKGTMPAMQLMDGDVILVSQRHSSVKIEGVVQNAFEFEFDSSNTTLQDLLGFAKPTAAATHVRVISNKGNSVEAKYYSLDEIDNINVKPGDVIEVTADKKTTSLAVRVEGEHNSKNEYVLNYGASLKELLDQIEFNKLSDNQSIQLFRNSVKARQKEMLGASLQALESSVLTARSGTAEAAKLRTQEAQLILQWVERAKSIQPRGQVVLQGTTKLENIILEAGDIVRIPKKTGLVMVHGEVMFPSAMGYRSKQTVEDYIAMAGGFTQNDSTSKVLLLHRDGTFTAVDKSDLDDQTVNAGDEIFVLPKVDVKSLQLTKDITQVLYQIAVSSRVLLGF